MFAGCAYRRRTGACCCPNPPIGCARDTPPAISFPAGLTSYRALREAQASQPQQQQPAPPPPRDIAPRAAQPLPLHAKADSAGVDALPALGWRVSAEDGCLASLASAGLLLYVDGEAAEEAAARAGGGAPLLLVVSSAASLQASLARLGRAPTAVLLRCGGEAWEAEWAALQAAASPAACGLAAPDVAAASAALRRLVASGGPPPPILALPLHPGLPMGQRALVGLCRRLRVRLLALSPLGDAALRAQPAAAAAGARREGGAAEALLAWCVGRGAAAVAGGEEGCGEELPLLLSALMGAGRVADLEAAERAALDALAPSSSM